MAIDKVLLRFSGATTTEQSQSLPGEPISTALPSSACRYYTDNENITGDYPIPGIEFVGADHGHHTWSGYQNMTVEIRVTADHATETYRLYVRLRGPGNTSDALVYSSMNPIEVYADLSTTEPLLLVFTDRNLPYVKLRVILSQLTEGTDTTYLLGVPAIPRQQQSDFLPHTGGYMSSYAPGPTEGNNRTSFALIEDVLQCVSFRSSTSPPSELQIGFGDVGDVFFNYGGSGAQYSAAGVRAFAGDTRYIALESGSGAVVLRYDPVAASKVIFMVTLGFQERPDRDIGMYGLTFWTSPQYRGINTLFPPVYRNAAPTKGMYIQNIHTAAVAVSFSVPSADSTLRLYLRPVSTTEPLHYTVGDGASSGVLPAEAAAGSDISLSSAPFLPSIEVPYGKVAGVLVYYSTSSPIEATSSTSLLTTVL